MGQQGKGSVASVSSTTPQRAEAKHSLPLSFFDMQRQLQQQEFEGTVDHLKNLLVQEKTHYAPCMDYLAVIAASRAKGPRADVSAAAPSHCDMVNEAWRRKLCEWCFDVVDHFGMEREVVSVAMNYLDRTVAKILQEHGHDYHIPKREFQLVAVASLYVAVKVHGETEDTDMDPRRLNVDVFVELSRGLFQAETIEAMEISILFNLNWHLNPPTPLKFVAAMMKLIPSWHGSELGTQNPASRTVFKAIFDVSMYLTELSFCVSTFTFHSKNSVIAYASILCAIEALEDALPLPYDARVKFVNQVAAVTGLLPESQEVRCVRNLLMDLCPAIQERDVASLIMTGADEEDDAGKASPICVSYGTPDELLLGRKHR
jgi:Cyclin, N-terminal domain